MCECEREKHRQHLINSYPKKKTFLAQRCLRSGLACDTAKPWTYVRIEVFTLWAKKERKIYIFKTVKTSYDFHIQTRTPFSEKTSTEKTEGKKNVLRTKNILIICIWMSHVRYDEKLFYRIRSVYSVRFHFPFLFLHIIHSFYWVSFRSNFMFKLVFANYIVISVNIYLFLVHIKIYSGDFLSQSFFSAVPDVDYLSDSWIWKLISLMRGVRGYVHTEHIQFELIMESNWSLNRTQIVLKQ